jgi:hypothetical protein
VKKARNGGKGTDHKTRHDLREGTGDRGADEADQRVDDLHERGGLDVLERHFKLLGFEHGIREGQVGGILAREGWRDRRWRDGGMDQKGEGEREGEGGEERNRCSLPSTSVMKHRHEASNVPLSKQKRIARSMSSSSMALFYP